MRSRKDYIITKEEVHGYAEYWLGSALRLEYQGYKCTTSVILQVLLIAASRVVSLFAACRDLADAPCNQAIRAALAATLPHIAELEKRLNRALVCEVPKSLYRKSRMVAIDLTLIPYHGQPAFDKKEIYRSKAKSGTTHFHAYATAVVVHKGYRYSVALTHVERGEGMKDVVQRLLKRVRALGIKVRFLLLDKGFYSVEVMTYLKRAGQRLRERGFEMIGIRLDSGDLAYLSIEARRILDEAGFPDAAIVASNASSGTSSSKIPIRPANPVPRQREQPPPRYNASIAPLCRSTSSRMMASGS